MVASVQNAPPTPQTPLRTPHDEVLEAARNLNRLTQQYFPAQEVGARIEPTDSPGTATGTSFFDQMVQRYPGLGQLLSGLGQLFSNMNMMQRSGACQQPGFMNSFGWGSRAGGPCGSSPSFMDRMAGWCSNWSMPTFGNGMPSMGSLFSLRFGDIFSLNIGRRSRW